jgi:ketosteroid isomerase-like protein
MRYTFIVHRSSFIVHRSSFIQTVHFRTFHMTSQATQEAVVARLLERAAAGNDAFMNGDMARWLALTPHSDDFSLVSPFGGWTAGGFDASPERLAEMAGYFTSATTSLEVISTHASADMIVLVVVERQHGIVGGLPPQDWSLRVTLVFRRNGADWDLVHRHADPLVQRITLNRLAGLASGGVDDAGDQA